MPQAQPRGAARRALVLAVLLVFGPVPAAPLAQAASTELGAAARGALTLDGGSEDGEQLQGVSDRSKERVHAVINTLNDILSSIENEERVEGANYHKFCEWCESEVKGFTEALEKTELQHEQGEVSEKELTATVADLQQAISDNGKEMATTRDSIDQEQAMREEEVDKYDQDLQLNQQSVDQITQAVNIVGKAQGRSGLLQARLSEPGESSYVLGIMRQLKDRLLKTRDQMQAAEGAKEKSHEELIATKKSQIGVLTSESSEKQQQFTKARSDHVEVKRVASRSQEQIQKLNGLAKKTKVKCDAKTTDWKVRSEDRAKEKDALRMTIDYLTGSGVGSSPSPAAPALLQVGAARQEQQRAVSASAGAALLGAADAELAALAAEGGSRSGQQGTFDAAKKVVNQLIAELQDQQKDEEKMSKFCEAKLAETSGEQAETMDELKTLKAGLEYRAAEITTLKSEVNEINQAIEGMQKRLEQAAALRKEEKGIYEAGAKDRKLAVKVLKQAEVELAKFYATPDKTAALAGVSVSLRASSQPASKPPPKTWSGSGRKDIQGKFAVDMIEKVSSEMQEEQRAAEKAEAEAAEAFEDLGRDTRDEFDAMMRDVTERLKRKAKLTVHLNADRETQTQRKADLESVDAQLRSLHEECDDLLEHFEERTKARNFELSQLKDVIDILSGSQIAPRTGFLQQEPGGGAAGGGGPELALLQDVKSKALRLAR